MTFQSKHEQYLAAVEAEADMLGDLQELAKTRTRVQDLRAAAESDLECAEAAKTAVEAAIRQAAVSGKATDSKTRQALTASVESIAECTLRIAALTDELASLATADRRLQDDVMRYRRHMSRMQESSEFECGANFLRKTLAELPPGVTLQGIARNLECGVHKLEAFTR